MIDITVAQLSDLKHAIGFRVDRVKEGKYTIWRNFFGVSNPQTGWEDMVSKGLATKGKKFEEIVYYVTKKGVKLLSDTLEVEIIDREDEALIV